MCVYVCVCVCVCVCVYVCGCVYVCVWGGVELMSECELEYCDIVIYTFGPKLQSCTLPI